MSVLKCWLLGQANAYQDRLTGNVGRVTDEQVRGFIHCLPSLDLLSVDCEVLFSECSRIRGFPFTYYVFRIMECEKRHSWLTWLVEWRKIIALSTWQTQSSVFLCRSLGQTTSEIPDFPVVNHLFFVLLKNRKCQSSDTSLLQPLWIAK